MQISWINKFTLIDFPGKIACVIFTPGCNFRCAFCHNPEFVLPENLKDIMGNLISEEAFFSFLEKRKWLLDWVSICWWEPSLQKDLVLFCEKVKSMWYAVKLDTNGQNPKVIQKLIDKNLINYIAMDIKNPPWKFGEIAWVELDEKPYLESIKILLNSNIDYEFRTTVIKWIHTKNDIEEISKYIAWAKKYFIQNFKKWKTLEANFSWESFSELELEEFLKIALKNMNNVEIRN